MLDIVSLMSALSNHRPIFHSEADFQHAFAWQIHKMMPSWKIRLEFNPFPSNRSLSNPKGIFRHSKDLSKSQGFLINPFPPNKKRIYLDIWIPNRKIAIELKYCTRGLSLEYDAELFGLTDQGAQDTRRYDFLKDMERLEGLINDENRPISTGVALLLTNDPLYWKDPSQKDTIDAAFRIHEGRKIASEKLEWGASASAGTKKGREASICLKNFYNLQWQNYSCFRSERYGKFRYLAVAMTQKKQFPPIRASHVQF